MEINDYKRVLEYTDKLDYLLDMKPKEYCGITNDTNNEFVKLIQSLEPIFDSRQTFMYRDNILLETTDYAEGRPGLEVPFYIWTLPEGTNAKVFFEDNILCDDYRKTPKHLYELECAEFITPKMMELTKLDVTILMYDIFEKYRKDSGDFFPHW